MRGCDGRATIGASWDTCTTAEAREDALAGRVDEDRPANRDRGRSTVVALTIGFVLSVTGFAFFTAWLIREA